MNKKINIVNKPLISNLITYMLLYKNLLNHYKIVTAVSKGILLNKSESPYQYLKHLLKNNPKVLNMVAIVQDRKITYKELMAESKTLANYLHFKLSVKKGDNISICAAGSIEGIVAFFACNKIGAVNARVFNGSQADKMKYSINDYNSRIVLTDNNNLQVLSKIIKDTKVKAVIVMSKCEEYLWKRFKEKNPQVQLISYDWIIQNRKFLKKDFSEKVSGKDLASILYTSGSSGEPKPISIPNRVYCNMVDIVCRTTNIPKCNGERVVSIVSHEYPYAAINCTVMILLMGKTLIMPRRRADNNIDFNQLMRTKPNRIQAIPNFFKLWKTEFLSGRLKYNNFGALNSIISGGEQYLDVEKQELLSFLADNRVSPILIDGFGFGEMGSATALKFGMSEYFLLMNGIEAKSINPQTGKDLPLDEEGILCFTGPTIATGYYNNTIATLQSFTKDKNGKNWFISDTYGSIHGKHKRLLKLGGRIREYFITADGEGNFVKIYAGTVENVIMTCQYVRDCIVVPSDASAMPKPIAYIAKNENCQKNEEQIITALKEKCQVLEKFAQPVKYEIVTDIAKTIAGKKDYRYYRRLNGF